MQTEKRGEYDKLLVWLDVTSRFLSASVPEWKISQ